MLRKMAMVGDAISHAVLPGIVIAFLLTGSRDSVFMIAGAASLGIFTTFFIQFLSKKARLQTDASIGVTFTWLFAVGVILITYYAGQIDLDQECVLYGEIAYVPLDLWISESGTVYGPKAFFVALSMLFLNLLFIGLNYHRLVITTFDPAFASALGIQVGIWNYLLMGAVSATTVAAFESVGAILIVALLVVPPATAYLITQRMHSLLALTTVFAVACSLLGYYLAYWLDASIAGSMVTVSGVLFAITFAVHRWRIKKATSDYSKVAPTNTRLSTSN